MEFRIADTFTDSLARLTNQEQRAVKTAAFDLQLNPAHPGMSLHRIERARDPNFWSVRASDDLRLIVHKTQRSLLLCYVNHHDKAYAWAASRRLETHPTTGAAQLVEVRETIQEVFVPIYVSGPAPEPMPAAVRGPLRKPPLFAHVAEPDLLGYGVPVEWLDDVREATEDTLLALADHLPGEAAEALLELATGGKPRVAQPAAPTDDPFQHPDAQRRFRVLSGTEELERALEFPWDRWTVFLHPEQRQLVEREYNGPARVAGSAGTGKTIVALHRAVFLAREHPDARILLTTFSDALAAALRTKLRRLVSNEPRLAERIDVHSLDAVGTRLYAAIHGGGVPEVATPEAVDGLLHAASRSPGAAQRFGPRFLRTEWDQVVDAWQLETWEAYRDVARLGRKTRLPEAQRAVLWSAFEQVRADLAGRGLMTRAALFTRLAERLGQGRGHTPYDFAVVDEAQDVGVAHLRFLAALGRDRPDALFFAGDQGQRIFQQPFSWKALGVDVRGRSRTLRVNYRTSHQIRTQADRLLGPQVSDADGNAEERNGTVSVFNGPPPLVREFDGEADECVGVAAWLTERAAAGVAPQEIGVFVRSAAQLPRARAAVEQASLPYRVLDDHPEDPAGSTGGLSVSTMHLAKGMEFRAVVVMACDDEVLPLQERIETVGDEADLQEVYDTERHLLYVACTRARDHLLLTSITPASEFLDDLRANSRT